MIDVVVIRDDLPQFTKGKVYRVIWGDRDAGTVCVKNDLCEEMHVQLDCDAIVLSSGSRVLGSKDFQDMLFSYGAAIHRCGGNPERFVNQIKKMSVMEMMETLAPNGVRFTTEVSHVNKELDENDSRCYTTTLY